LKIIGANAVKPHVIGFTLSLLMTCFLLPPVIAQGVTVDYVIHVDFFAYACSLDITQVSLYDPSGNLLGVASSPYGGEVAISVRTPTPIDSITATAYGQATWASYYSWTVGGSRTVVLGDGGDYWITLRMS